VVALLMALATLSTAWCSYQSAAWTRASNRLINEFNTLERRAALLNIQGLQSATIHATMFMQVIAAKEAGNGALARFYVDRFPAEMRKAYDAWLAQKPFDNPDAAAHPFDSSLYELRGSREATEASSKSAEALKNAREAGTVSGEYLANTVLFAAVLFFANAAGKFEQPRVRNIAVIFAVAVFLFAVTRMVLLPTS
jgi:hypothetical protein